MTDNEKPDEPDEPAEFSISPESMTAILCEAAQNERTVVEFQTQVREDGVRELHRAIDITNHVEKLEER